MFIWINIKFTYIHTYICNVYIDIYNLLAGSHGLGDTPCYKFSKSEPQDIYHIKFTI